MGQACICIIEMLGRVPTLPEGEIWLQIPYLCIVMHLKAVRHNDASTYRVEIVKSIRDADGNHPSKKVIETIDKVPLGERLDN